eukprot:symbB.v1.2.021324.t1/scaffold1838.1/size108694/4
MISGANLRSKDEQRLLPLQLALAQQHLHLLPIFDANNGFALEAAGGFGNVTLVRQMILEQGYSPYVTDDNGRSMIFETLEKGQVKVAEFLVTRNVSLIQVDHQGISVLGAAALAEQPSAVEFLLQTVPVWQRMANGSTALHLAAQGPQKGANIVNILLRAGARSDAATYRNRTALHFSANAAVVEALLEGNATVEWQDIFGATPLHLAAAEGRASTVEALLASRTTQVDALDGEGKTALYWAAVGRHTETVQTLLRWCGTLAGVEIPSALPENLRGMLITGIDEQCQCDCGKFQFDPLFTMDSWLRCSTTVRCRFGGGSGQELRCARNRSVSLNATGTGQWQPAQLNINCRAVSSALQRVVGWWSLLVTLSSSNLKTPCGLPLPELSLPKGGSVRHTNAILRKVAQIYEDSELMGNDFIESGLVDSWLDWTSMEVDHFLLESEDVSDLLNVLEEHVKSRTFLETPGASECTPTWNTVSRSTASSRPSRNLSHGLLCTSPSIHMRNLQLAPPLGLLERLLPKWPTWLVIWRTSQLPTSPMPLLESLVETTRNNPRNTSRSLPRVVARC